MSEVSVELLFDEFATRYIRGERPDVGEYLERAGPEREELGRLLDRFLAAVPAREPSEEEIVLIEASLASEGPIFALRKRRALTRDAVVDALVQALGLDPAKRGKVGRYYHELETGLLDPEPVDASVWAALADFLRANIQSLAGFRPPLLAAPVARRDADADWALRLEARAPAAAADEGPDEVDRLFTGNS